MENFLQRSDITWVMDGKTVLSGPGEREMTFTVGSLGTQTRIQVVVDSPTEGRLTKSFTFNPAAVNLLWEADTSVPPLYRGKPLYSAGSKLTVFAFPAIYSGGSPVAAGRLSYQWFRDDEPVPEKSGLGRSSLSFDGDQLRTEEIIAVDAYLGQQRMARGEILIPATEPQLLLYYRDPLRGVLYDQALPAGVALGAKEFSIRAEPFFFSNTSLAGGSLAYAWTLNGNETVGPSSADGYLTLRQTGEGEGSAALEVALQNNDSDKFVQTARAALELIFGRQQESILSSFFGL